LKGLAGFAAPSGCLRRRSLEITSPICKISSSKKIIQKYIAQKKIWLKKRYGSKKKE